VLNLGTITTNKIDFERNAQIRIDKDARRKDNLGMKSLSITHERCSELLTANGSCTRYPIVAVDNLPIFFLIQHQSSLLSF